MKLDCAAFNVNQVLAGEELRTDCAVALWKVFNNGGLLEVVFLELNGIDLREVTQTCRATRRLLRDSNPIHIRMCLVPDHDCPGYLFLQTLRKKNLPSVRLDVGTENIIDAGYGYGSVFNYWLRFGANEILPHLKGSSARCSYLSHRRRRSRFV